VAIEDYSDMVKNTSWLLSANMISRIFTAIFIILLANHLLPESFGTYNFAFSTAFILSVIPEFGFDALIVKEISKKPQKIPNMISNILTLRVLLSLITIMILWVISFFALNLFEINLHVNILLLAFLTLLFEKLSGAFFAVFRARGLMSYQSYVIVFWKILYLIFGISAILLGYDLFNIIVLILCASIFQFVLSSFFYLLKMDHHFSSPNFRRWKTLIYSAYPFALFSFLNMLYGHITIVLISIIKNPLSTGLFSAGWKLIIFLGVIPHSFGRALFPFFTKIYSSKPDLIKISCIRSTRNLLQIAFPITIILFIITPDVIDLIFASGYKPTIYVFRILVWMIPFLFMNGSLRMVLWSTDKTIESSKNLFYSSLFLLIIGIFLIINYGITGAAVTVVSAEIVYFIINYFKVKESLGAIWNKDFTLTSIISLISIILMFRIINYTVVVKYLFMLLFVPFYFITLFKLGAIKKEDLDVIKSLKNL